MTSSVIVVEIDTRKGPVKTVFESSIENQTEQAKQFWKTLSLAPHIESSLYSKEIRQQLKSNTLKPISIDNSRKVAEIMSPKTQYYLEKVDGLNRIDEMNKIKKQAQKIEEIRLMHKATKEKSNQVNSISRTALMKSESESRWLFHLADASQTLKQNEKIVEDDNNYEQDLNQHLDDENDVKNLK